MENINSFFKQINNGYAGLTSLIENYNETTQNLTIKKDLIKSEEWIMVQKSMEKLFIDFCNIWHWSPKNIDGNINLNKIYHDRLMVNHPDTYNVIKNMVKWQLLIVKNKYSEETFNKLENDFFRIVAVNTINKKCFIAGITSSESIQDPERFWWTSKNIDKMINEIMDEFNSGNNDVTDANGDSIFKEKPAKKNTYDILTKFGLEEYVEETPLTEEWFIETIGDEKTVAGALRKIADVQPRLYPQRARKYLKKYNLIEKLNLELRKYSKRNSKRNSK